jgi:hypothetical protein
MLLPFLHSTTHEVILIRCIQDPDAPPPIVGPFATRDGQFVYDNARDLVWYLCGDLDSLDILLGAPGFVVGDPNAEQCTENVKLYAHE